MNEFQFQINEAIARASGDYDFHVDELAQEGLSLNENPRIYNFCFYWEQKPQRKPRVPQYFVTFSSGAIRFSNDCVEMLKKCNDGRDVDYIHLLIDKAGNRMAIQIASDTADPDTKFSFLHDWKEKCAEAEAAIAAGDLETPIPKKEAKITRRVAELRKKLKVEGNHRFSGEWIADEKVFIFDMGKEG